MNEDRVNLDYSGHHYLGHEIVSFIEGWRYLRGLSEVALIEECLTSATVPQA